MITGACYVRVSTENQLENYSIEEQTDRLKAYCRAKGITIKRFYTDGGYSGGNLNRPALRQLLEDIETNAIDTVVVYKLDRLSRSQKDTLTLIEDRFLANGVDFISVSENFDTSTPFGRAMIGILSVFAQLEKDQITERFTMGRIGRAKNGYFHGGAYPPTGYDYQDGNLTVNEYEALQVRELFERFAKGYSLHSCWQYMKDRYTTRYGPWKSETLVRNVLKNEIYIGRDKFKGVSYEGSHEPIIPRELFDNVQKLFDSSPKGAATFTRSPFKAGTLLSSLIRCGRCGAKFHGEHGNYTCYSRSKGDKKYVVDPECKNKKWKTEDLDRLVVQAISGLNFCELKQTPGRGQTGAEKDFSKRISDIDKQIKKLMDLYQIGDIPIEMVSKRIGELTKEKTVLEEHAVPPSPRQKLETSESSPSASDRFLALQTRGGLPERRYCLTLLIEKIVIDGEHVNIVLKHF